MQRLINIMTVMLVISGCQMGYMAINKEPSRFQSLIACEQALSLEENVNDNSKPSKKYRRSECPECHGKGYIMSGDGLFKQNCPYCEPDSSVVGSPWSCPCGGVCQCMNGECKSPNCPTNRSGSIIKGKDVRVMCGENCVCENGKCKCENPKDCINITASEINPNGCCVDCICPRGKCICTYPGECLVKRNGGKVVKICGGGSCRQYSMPAKASNLPSNAKATITQPKTQPTKKASPTYIYSNGARCGPSGWGTSSGGGRRLGFGGRGIF